MVRSAPEVSFTVTSVDYGTIDVGASSAVQDYFIYLSHQSTSHTEAINMSISFKEKTNASEARGEQWVKISTLSESWIPIGSVGTGSEAFVGTLVAGTRTDSGAGTGTSKYIETLISVPATAATAGAVEFYLHHRYQYTGFDDY